jgi:hypothetical protein
MATTAIRPGTLGAPPRRVGVLVIHGIGDENPYGTLDSFARGLYTHFENCGPHGYDMAAEWKERGADPSHEQKSWTQAQIRFTPPPTAGQTSPPTITMAEYYWSPATKGRLKDLDVLTWLIRTSLEPFRYLSENISAMEEAAQADAAKTGQKHGRKKGVYDGGVIVLRELFRLAFLYPFLIAAILAIGAFLETLPKMPSMVAGIQWGFPNDAAALIAAVRLLVLASLGGYFLGFYKWMRFRNAKSAVQQFSWFTLSGAVVFAALFLFGPVLLSRWTFHTIGGLGAFVSEQPILVGWYHIDHWLAMGLGFLTRWLLLDDSFSNLTLPLLSLGIAAGIRLFFVDFLGDVAIYTNLNQRSANFAIRAQILEECGHALTSLYLDLRDDPLNKDNDFQIVIAAHSLGTVIAYDTLNDLFNRARIGAPPVGCGDAPPARPVTSMEICAHMRGMLTFGSPLNKTYYFFRDQSAAEELVRAQIIDGLHSFRLAFPAGQLAGAAVQPVSDNSVKSLIERFRWINVWATMDVVSGKLFFYEANEQVHRPYKVLFPWSHLRYWRDPEMYRVFARNLLR